MSTMNVNEACALAKKIEAWKRDLNMLLVRKEYVFDITETHQKNLADETKESEILVNQTEKQYDVTVEDICSIIEALINEKTTLAELIEDTKNNLKVTINGKEMSVDAATEYNKGIRDFAYSLNSLCRNKNTTVKGSERDFRLDIEGKQTSYVYPCITEYKLTFDKAVIENKKKELTKEADKNSIEIDKARITSELEFDTVLDINDSLEEVIAKLKK